jgi:hypothetical protein
MPWNTITAPTDLERIRRALKVPAEKTYLDILRTAMSRVEKESPDSIATVQELLDNLDGNRTKRMATLGDASSALIKADVLEWQPGAKTDGMDTLRAEWIQELTAALYLEIPNQAYGYGTLRRS